MLEELHYDEFSIFYTLPKLFTSLANINYPVSYYPHEKARQLKE